jgi:hypothetical protein
MKRTLIMEIAVRRIVAWRSELKVKIRKIRHPHVIRNLMKTLEKKRPAHKLMLKILKRLFLNAMVMGLLKRTIRQNFR